MKRSDRAFDQAGVGDDVIRGATIDRTDGDHGRMSWPNLTRDDGLQLCNQHRGGDDRIDRMMWIRGVAGLAAHDNVEPVRRRQAGAMHEAESADRDLRVVVEPEGQIDPGAVHDAVGNHGLHAADTLLGRLEHQLDGARELRRELLENRGNTDQRRCVDIVAAGMHQAGLGAGERQAGPLLDRQRVHVGTDSQHRAGATALDQANDTGLADAGLVGDAKSREFACNDPGGTYFLEAEFRVGVDVAADFDQCRLDPLGGVADRGRWFVGEGHDRPS